MATNRRLAMYIIVITTVLAVIGTLLFLSCTDYEDLSITDMQFEEVYLNITLKNNGIFTTLISEVTLYQNSTPFIVPVIRDLGIAGGTQTSLKISLESFNCTSGYTYQIVLTTARGNSYSRTAVAP